MEEERRDVREREKERGVKRRKGGKEGVKGGRRGRMERADLLLCCFLRFVLSIQHENMEGRRRESDLNKVV